MAVTGISELLEQQFEAHQQHEGTLSHSASARAASIKKQITSFTLNNAVSSLSLTGKGRLEETEEEEVALLLVQYVDAAVAIEINSETQEPVDRVMDLAAALAVIMGEDTTHILISRSLKFSSALLERVRGQACQFMGFLASHLNDSRKDWARESLSQLLQALEVSLTDKSQSVRNSAIRATTHCFADLDAAEDILETLLWSLWHDPSVANRMAAVHAVPITSETVDHIISRVRDVKEKVRVQALEVLRTKVDPVSHLSQDQFAEVIRSGLSVRCEATKTGTVKLICTKWMKSSKFDPVALLKLMGVTVNEEESAKVVEVVLETARSGDVEMLSELSDPEIRAFQASAEKSLIRLANPDQILEPEAIFFARMACSTAMESPLMTLTQRDDALNKVVPDIPVLCEIFQRHAVRLIDAIKMEESETEDNECFICLQLLNLAKATDLQEEGSRRHFSSVMKRALLSGETPDDLVEGCVLAMCAAHEHEQGFLETIVQTASELSGEEVDDSRLLRIISILTIVLENASSKISTNVAVQDFARYIIPAVAHSNPLVREAGISCFGKLGLFTNESTVLEEFKPILLKAAFDEDEKLEIRGQALLALSDWSMLFSDMLQPSNVEGKDLSFLDLVKTLMIHPRQGIAAIAAEVAAKLLFSGRICESTLIAQLLLLFFDPTMTEADGDDSEVKEVGSPVRLQQLLSLFFPAYCINSEIGRDAVMGSISSMLNLVHQKPKTKKRKAAMPVVKMIEYICSIVDAGRRVSSQAESGELSTSNASSEKSQSAIMPSTALVSSLQVAQFLIQESSNLTNTTVRALCKFIGGHDIDVQIESKAHLLQLQEYLEELGMLLTDAPSLRSMALLNDSLVGVEDEENGRVQNDDSSEATETEDEMESTGETTLEDSLMDSMLALSVKEGKENMKAPSKAGISKRSVSGRRSRASSIGSSIGNVSVFESIGN